MGVRLGDMTTPTSAVTDRQIRELMDRIADKRGNVRLYKSCLVALTGATAEDIRRGETSEIARQRCAAAIAKGK